jgi:hypothetical protein
MGEIYRARDLRLKRDDAIKVFPTEFSRDLLFDAGFAGSL